MSEMFKASSSYWSKNDSAVCRLSLRERACFRGAKDDTVFGRVRTSPTFWGDSLESDGRLPPFFILKGCQPRESGRHSELASIPSGCKSPFDGYAPGVSRTLNPRLMAEIPSG